MAPPSVSSSRRHFDRQKEEEEQAKVKRQEEEKEERRMQRINAKVRQRASRSPKRSARPGGDGFSPMTPLHLPLP